MKIKNLIPALVLAIGLAACGASEQGTIPADNSLPENTETVSESITIETETQTETEMQTETESEIETETMTETETAPEETTVLTTSEADKNRLLTVEDGTVLDPDVCAKETSYGMEIPLDGKAYLLAKSDSGTNMYGLLPPEETEGLYVYITHNGIVDSFPAREYNFKYFGELGDQYCGDIDNDGEEEFVSAAPWYSGVPMCSMMSLFIYDKTETGHYEAHSFDDYFGITIDRTPDEFMELIDKCYTAQINNDEKTAAFSSLSSDAVYACEIETEDEPGEFSIINLLDSLRIFHVDAGGKITMEFPTAKYSTPDILPDTGNLPCIEVEVVYDGKSFSFENTSFTEG